MIEAPLSGHRKGCDCPQCVYEFKLALASFTWARENPSGDKSEFISWLAKRAAQRTRR